MKVFPLQLHNILEIPFTKFVNLLFEEKENQRVYFNKNIDKIFKAANVITIEKLDYFEVPTSF